MSKKFFYNKVYNPQRTRMIIYTAVGGVIFLIAIIIIIAICISNGKAYTCDDHIVKQKSNIYVEINSELPDKKEFFEELKCVKEKAIKLNSKSINLKKLGDYEAIIKIKKDTYKVNVKVIDSMAPKLVAKNASIKFGTSYNANSFLESCEDNSKEACQVSFYNVIKNYEDITAIGKHDIKIVAKDSSGNQAIANAILEITP